MKVKVHMTYGKPEDESGMFEEIQTIDYSEVSAFVLRQLEYFPSPTIRFEKIAEPADDS